MEIDLGRFALCLVNKALIDESPLPLGVAVKIAN